MKLNRDIYKNTRWGGVNFGRWALNLKFEFFWFPKREI